jgi:hypothetical protein
VCIVSGGSWVTTAVAVGISSGSSVLTAIVVNRSQVPTTNCCGQNEVGHGLVQQLLWTILSGSWVNAAVAAGSYQAVY